MLCMGGDLIPTWTLGDRLRKAREHAGLTVQDMADQLGYHRNSITAWETDSRPIKYGLLRAWAEICGISLAWLTCGDTPRAAEPYTPRLFEVA